MEYLRCVKCYGYKKYNVDDLKSGDLVYFYNYNKSGGYIILKGFILSKSVAGFKVSDGNKKYLVDKENIYPYDAPVAMIYNMFGVCEC